MPSLPSAHAMAENARAEFGALAEAFLDAYPCSDDAQARAASSAMVGERNFVWQNWTWARLHSAARRAPAYYYEFCRKPPIPAGAKYLENPPERFGAFHGAEIPYLFGNLDVRAWPWQASDRRLSEMMSAYWLNFARTGDPNGAGLAQWPAFDTASPRGLRFDEAVQVLVPPPRARLELWDHYFLGRKLAQRESA
jgi:para-nitrobenzyl esterase